MWIVLALLSAFCETAKDVISKKSSNTSNEYITAFSLQLFAAVTLLPIVLFVGIPHIKPLFWIALFVLGISFSTWSILYTKALKSSPISVTIPMLAFNPIFVAILSFVFDHKLPSGIGWLGISFICIGLYFLRLNKEVIKKGLLYPLINIFHEPGAMMMLGVAFIWSVGVHVNKIAVTNSSSLFASFSAILLASIILFFVARFKTTISIKEIRKNFKFLFPIGFFNGLSEFALFSALGVGYTPYVVSIKRTNILWSSILSRFLYQDELGKIKLVGLIVMFIGVVFVII